MLLLLVFTAAFRVMKRDQSNDDEDNNEEEEKKKEASGTATATCKLIDITMKIDKRLSASTSDGQEDSDGDSVDEEKSATK